MTTPISDEAKKVAQKLWAVPFGGQEKTEALCADIIQSAIDSATAELRAQLHACIAASKDMHAAQAGTIDELRAQVADLSAKLGIEPTAPKTWNLMFDELVSLRAQVERLTKERDEAKTQSAKMAHRAYCEDESEDCPFCAICPVTGHEQQVPMCPMCQIESELSTIRARLAEVEAERDKALADREYSLTAIGSDAYVKSILAERDAALSALADEKRYNAEWERQIMPLEALLADEKAIVNRIWEIYGTPSYAELKGRSIYDLIEADRAALAEAKKELEGEKIATIRLRKDRDEMFESLTLANAQGAEMRSALDWIAANSKTHEGRHAARILSSSTLGQSTLAELAATRAEVERLKIMARKGQPIIGYIESSKDITADGVSKGEVDLNNWLVGLRRYAKAFDRALNPTTPTP